MTNSDLRRIYQDVRDHSDTTPPSVFMTITPYGLRLIPGAECEACGQTAAGCGGSGQMSIPGDPDHDFLRATFWDFGARESDEPLEELNWSDEEECATCGCC